jgi:hypothetical protein
MNTKRLSNTLLAWLALSCLLTTSVLAQTDQGLVLSLSRDFGYSSGTGKIQGRFSMKVEGPEDLVRVAFYIDEQLVGEDDQPPYRYQFNTSSFAQGVHTIYVVGYTHGGEELHSNQQIREFVAAGQVWRIVMPVLVIVLGISVVGFLISSLAARSGKNAVPPGQPRTYSPLGGAICPRCRRPFSFHIYSVSLVIGRLDHCPHCGKWSFLRRKSLAQLQAAEAAELDGVENKTSPVGMTEEERKKRDLEDSRYQDYV